MMFSRIIECFYSTEGARFSARMEEIICLTSQAPADARAINR